jgi:hypothetical protein
MTENIIDNIRISDLENSLVIIEDIILSDFKNYKISLIVSEICTLGRFYNVSCIVSVRANTLYNGSFPIRQLHEFNECIKLPEQRLNLDS